MKLNNNDALTNGLHSARARACVPMCMCVCVCVRVVVVMGGAVV